ncbi:YceI family protein [Nocardiopsis sp. CC223A]|uniref:YceI family protein n=1 Tax=Nocardiopsis sp. CC223A TaxID=3044051 RepID=UPI00278C82AD|nr:YceI family protein [Nocardiopsis sp. CC223A]
MRTGTKIAIGAGTAVVVLGGAALVFGPGLYADMNADRAEAAPTVDSPGVSDVTDVAAFNGDWTVVEGESYAGYRVDEVLQGQDVTVTGRTPDVAGTVSVADGSVTAAEITVDMTTVATDNDNRDEYFRDNALNTGEFPTSTFTLTEPVAVEPGAESVALVGDLTVHGVTVPVTIDAEVGLTDTGARVAGSVPVTFADFGVQAPDLGFVSVEEAGEVEFLLDLVQNP